MRFGPSLTSCLLSSIVAMAGCSPDGQTVATHPASEAHAPSASPGRSPCDEGAVATPSARLLRLPDGEAPPPPRFVWPVEIDGESREALGLMRARQVLGGIELTLPRGVRAPLRRRIDLDEAFVREATRLLVTPQVHTTGWEELDPFLADVVRDETGVFADVELDLTSLRNRRGRAQLSAIATPLPDRAATLRTLGPLRIPNGEPWLSTEVGVLPPARGQGPVRFRISVCERGQCSCRAELEVDPERQAWTPMRVPLEAYAGREVRIRYESEVVAPGPGAFDLGQWARPRWLAPLAPGAPGRHDVIVISIDTLRADHLEAYGYGRETSPFVSGDFATRGAVLEQVTAPATTTAPSHMSLFTSLQPSVHGVASNMRENGLPEGVPTLASVLRDAGFATGSFNENGAMIRKHGFGRGFDEYAEVKGETRRSPPGHADDVFRLGADFVRRHRHERWMLFVHTYAVHDPYTPEEAYSELWPEGDADDHPDNTRMASWRDAFRPVLYDREIRQLDAAFEDFIAGLEADGLLDDAIVVLTSDHGEAFFEHGLLGHGGDTHQEAVHVPLIAAGPGIGEGRRIGAPASLIDLMPTLLDLVEVPAPGGLMGRSLAPLLRGEAADESWATRPIVSETWHPWARTPSGRVPADPPTLAVRRGRFKLIRRTGGPGPAEALFDLEADPFERVDLLETDLDASVQRELEALRAAAEEYAASMAAMTDALGLPPFDPRPADESALSPERREALRALGYIE